MEGRVEPVIRAGGVFPALGIRRSRIWRSGLSVAPAKPDLRADRDARMGTGESRERDVGRYSGRLLHGGLRRYSARACHLVFAVFPADGLSRHCFFPAHSEDRDRAAVCDLVRLRLHAKTADCLSDFVLSDCDPVDRGFYVLAPRTAARRVVDGGGTDRDLFQGPPAARASKHIRRIEDGDGVGGDWRDRR